MTHQDFAHLHVHTEGSLRDGLGTTSRLVGAAKDMGFSALAMTDHGTLANAVTFTIECLSAGVKPIMGMEGYIAYDGAIGHITLLADGDRGWQSLVALNNLAQLSPFKQPAFTVDELTKHADGLVCLTGCISSPFQQLSPDDAYRLGVRLKSAFGSRLFAELMFVGDSLSWERPIKLSERLGIKRVITNDVHFPYREDGGVHSILTKMKSGFSYDSSKLFLRSDDEILQAARRHIDEDDVRDAMKRTVAIAGLIGAVDLRAEPRLPDIHSAPGELSSMVMKSGRWRDVRDDPRYHDRVEHELAVVEDMGYSDYFLILEDIIAYARDHGVKVGPGRGSGAGSLILYFLGITDVDPIKHDLQFERFLNPERRGMPDVDVDLEAERRDRVLDFASRKYDAVPIATYAHYSHKSLVRDLGRFFRVDQGLIDEAADGGVKSDAFSKIAEMEPKLAHAYDAFIGQIRHKGKHAGGVIITDTDYPLERVSDTHAAGWSEGQKNELSYAGIVKFDLLGLSALSALRRLEELLGDSPDEPTPGHPAFEIFRKGDLSGVFQFSGSDGIRDLTMRLQPDKFEDLVAINALYRPGAIDAGSMEKYPEWKSDPREVHEYIADVLEPTYGAIVFQEQFMEIYRRTVGGTLGDADTARRVIAKGKDKRDDPRWIRKFEVLHGKFINGAVESHGLTYEEANDLWGELETHVRYSFNRAHSTAYSMIAWETAWWKFNYPVYFYATMLNIDQENEQTYIIDALRSGIEIKPPHVNRASDEYVAATSPDIIYLPLGSIKYLGPTGVSAILTERGEFGEFESMANFMERVPKRYVRARAREGLLMMRGFSGLVDTPYMHEAVEILELKESPRVESWTARQLKYLGYLIPTPEMMREFNRLEAEGWTCGVVSDTDQRTSKWGPYTVYRLAPSGVFWSRDVKDLRDGEVIAVKIDESNGRAKVIRKLL